MRLLAKNQIPVWYALYKGKTPILNENGDDTGQYSVEYENPVRIRANVSAAAGDVSTRQFGDALEYDRVVMTTADTPIDEHAVLWIDAEPELADDGSLVTDEAGIPLKTWNYIVKKVARSLNSASVAVSRVNVNG